MQSEHLTLNLNEGSVTFHFTPQAAQTLQAAIADLMNTLKANAAKTPGMGSPRPTQQPPMEYRYTGEVFLELFCNPNIWLSPFAAKVLLTLRDDRIRVTTEIALSQLQEDLNQYLEQTR